MIYVLPTTYFEVQPLTRNDPSLFEGSVSVIEIGYFVPGKNLYDLMVIFLGIIVHIGVQGAPISDILGLCGKEVDDKEEEKNSQ